MGASKIVDESEVIRWFEQGKTYREMSEIYRDKYNLEMTGSAWGNFRRRKGLGRRTVRDDELIPWAVKVEHRWDYHLQNLRREARRRAGMDLTEREQQILDGWKRNMEAAGAVVHYDPETEDGFFSVPRRPGIDTDLIRKPSRVTGKKAAD